MASSSSTKRRSFCGSAVRSQIASHTRDVASKPGQYGRDPGLAEDGEVLSKQSRARRGQVRHAAEIEYQQWRARRLARQPARDVVDCREIQRPDQLDHADVAVVLVKDLLFMWLAAAARRYAEYIVIRDDAGADIGAAVEHVEIEPRRQRLADFQPPDAVAMAVEPRRESAEPDLRRKRGDDAAADAALGRHADAIDPFAGVIIHARTRHHRQRPRHDVGRDHLDARHRIDAAVGQGRRHDSKIARGHQHGALPEIGIQHGIDVALDHRVIAQQPGDRAIAIAGDHLGPMHGVVDPKFAAGELAQLLPDTLEGRGAST